MAKIRLSDFLTGIRGSQNGTTYSRNRGGTYRKNKPIPTNPQTIKQAQVRGTLGSLSTAWAGLTEAQRAAWNVGALGISLTDSLGNEYNPSGQNLFIGWNAVLERIGDAPNDDFPGSTEIPAQTNNVCTMAETGQSVSLAFAPSPVPTGFELIIYATAQMSAGIYSPRNVYRFIQSAAAASTTPINLATPYLNKFPAALVAGQKVFWRTQLVALASGQTGPLMTSSAIIAA